MNAGFGKPRVAAGTAAAREAAIGAGAAEASPRSTPRTSQWRGRSKTAAGGG